MEKVVRIPAILDGMFTAVDSLAADNGEGEASPSGGARFLDISVKLVGEAATTAGCAGRGGGSSRGEEVVGGDRKSVV